MLVVYSGTILSISFSVLEVTVEMWCRSRFSPIPVLYLYPSHASFRAVWEQFCLWLLALTRLKSKDDFRILSLIT